MEYDVFADWRINILCNFRCDYCFYSFFFDDEKKQNSEYGNHSSIEKIINGFNKSGLSMLIHITGGEPFLERNFLNLCNGLTEKHYLGIDTNLSTRNIYDFAEQVDPTRVPFIRCSLHIDERKRLNLVKDFINKYHYLKSHNFNIFVIQVLYPPIIRRFDEILEYFLKNGIVITPKIFRGYYKQKSYPHSYTKRQKDKIIKYCDISRELNNQSRICIDPYMEKEFIKGNLSFTDLLCEAGKRFVLIEHNGDIMRCQGEATNLGNIFEGRINLMKHPKPCSAKICPCPYFGLRFAKGLPRTYY